MHRDLALYATREKERNFPPEIHGRSFHPRNQPDLKHLTKDRSESIADFLQQFKGIPFQVHDFDEAVVNPSNKFIFI